MLRKLMKITPVILLVFLLFSFAYADLGTDPDPGPYPARIKVYVTDHPEGVGIQGAVINITDPAVYSNCDGCGNMTGFDGLVELRLDLESQNLTQITVEASGVPGYSPMSKMTNVVAFATVDLVFVLLPDPCSDLGGNTDDDEWCNNLDNCPDIPNTNQADNDADGVGDACDICPDDPNKSSWEGLCGCGILETDSDNDGTPDCIDNCPEDYWKTEPGTCGCGIPDDDLDNDGTVGCLDNCPTVSNDQSDTDNDTRGDACDNCPLVPNDQTDTDKDGFGDICDNPRYEIFPDKITDLESGLVWQRSPQEETVDSWTAAVDYCKEMNSGDIEGWYLPMLEEFNSLVDKSRSNPALPENHPFNNVKVDQGWYWSSTTDPVNSENAYYVDMSDGNAFSFDKRGNLGLAWCVRSDANSRGLPWLMLLLD